MPRTVLDRAIYQINREDEEAHVKQQAASYNLPYVNLVGYPILPNTLKILTPEEVLKFSAVPFMKAENKIRVALVDPNPDTIAFLQSIANKTKTEISLALCSPTSFKFGLTVYMMEEQKKGKNPNVEVTTESQHEAIESIKSPADIETKIAKANATRLLDILFAAATGMEASDIHIEPQENDVRVRFRIDGVLQDVTKLEKEVFKQVVQRVKYLAKIKLDVKQINQDGRFTITVANTKLDVRVSTLPTAYGEIVDMRLLRSHAETIKIDDLGLTPEALTAIKSAIALPHGMILVTGPTGSGKTTTLYAVLDSLNKPGVKIITLEDPIEYQVPGIDQVGVDPSKGLTFAEALKGVLRQDPDIIMVGEIRDKETADIGLQASMTGHLFLSTLHTNSAPASLARLIDMGIEPYKIAGSINLIIAQRLVRRLCPNCHGTGCPICHSSGYKGRLPIIEVLKPSKAIDDAVMARASVRDIYAIAIQQGMVPMYQDGINKVSQGLTTKEEVERVTAELE